MNDHELDALLTDTFTDEHIDNDGFTERVVAHLPRRPVGFALRTAVLAVSALAACLVVLVSGVDVVMLGHAATEGLSRILTAEMPSVGWIAGAVLVVLMAVVYVRESLQS